MNAGFESPAWISATARLRLARPSGKFSGSLENVRDFADQFSLSRMIPC